MHTLVCPIPVLPFIRRVRHNTRRFQFARHGATSWGTVAPGGIRMIEYFTRHGELTVRHVKWTLCGMARGLHTRGSLLLAVAVLLGFSVLWVAAAEEPYHIDELRQVRSYELPPSEIIQRSFEQTQPPLDALLNATVQQVVGQGDVRQRALSVLAGGGSLILLGVLGRRAGLGAASAVGVLIYAASPLIVSVTAYARPYALPTFLMLFFILLVDVWLKSRNRYAAVLMTAVGFSLPLSRALEPVIFLVATIAVLGSFQAWSTRKRTEWSGSPILPIAVAAVSLVTVAGPMLLLLRRQVADFVPQSDALTTAEQLIRLVQELPVVLAAVIPAWPAILVVLVLAVVVDDIRHRLQDLWWMWVLVAVPIGFAVLFFARVETTQPYFERYAFTWWAPLAIVIAVTAHWASSVCRVQHARPLLTRIAGSLGVVALVAAAFTSVVTLGKMLTTTAHADFKEAAQAIEAIVPPGSVVLFDHVRPFGAYRTFFAGKPRYLASEWPVLSTVEVAAAPRDRIQENDGIAILLLDARPDVPGYIRIPVTEDFTLYIPRASLVGLEGAVLAYLDIAEAMDDDLGHALRAAAASALSSLGREAAAQDLVDLIIDDAEGDPDHAVGNELSRYRLVDEHV